MGDIKLRGCPRCGTLVRGRVCPLCGTSLGGLGAALRRLDRMLPPGRLTMGLLAFFALMFLASVACEMWLAGRRGESPFSAFPAAFFWGAGAGNVMLGSAHSLYVAHEGQYWRWITACFLHFGILHIGFNGYALRDLGRMCEVLWGKRRVWSLFIITGVAGNALAYAWDVLRPFAWDRWVNHKPEASGELWQYLALTKSFFNVAGASGAICGLLGAMIAAWVTKRGVSETLGRALRNWAISILVFGLLVPNVSNSAHIGGFLAGFGVAYFFMKPRAWTRPGSFEHRAWSVVGVISALAFIASFAAMLLYFPTLAGELSK